MQSRTDLAFHAMHEEGILMLANCWDGGSARIADAAGSRALATSSGAVAWAHGYSDGYQLPTELLLATVRDIARASKLPLTVDIEDGYSDDPAQVVKFVEELMATGVVGINIEDGSKAPELLVSKISAIRAAADKAGVKLYINARCDVFLRGLAPPLERAAEMLRRAALYKQAGASGLFAAGAAEHADIAAIVEGASMPVNLLALATLPPPERLAAMGVRRLSAGSAPAEAMFGRAAFYMKRFLQTGEIDDEQSLTYGALNQLMKSE
ncbi:isocitrate lyase/PEP mutase family protein [Pseudoduganella sp. RAF53_2]|uniref:isocitrate lyase/PEP mutase family protein n=1 Tax=unclassified Pseudoduganella TaxID=2637179 RepID=UPI003F95D8F6